MIEKKREALVEKLEHCLRCKFCATYCPIFDPSKSYMRTAVGKNLASYYILRDLVEPNEEYRDWIYFCTTCAMCDTACDRLGASLENSDIVEEMRRLLIYEYNFPLKEEHQRILDWGKKEFNPYFEKNADRWAWLTGKSLKAGEYMYFAGCTSAFRMQHVALATMNVLRKLDVDVAPFADEQCCSSVYLRIGLVDDAMPMIEENARNLNLRSKDGVKGVITSCAGCYRTLKKDYPKYVDLDIEVLHSSELLDSVMSEKRMKFKEGLRGERVTYHDPCHLGRHSGIYEAPRRILEQIPDVEFIEMPSSGEDGKCCGAGGGFRSGYTEFSLEVASKRIQEAKEIGVNMIVSCCPFCELNLKQAPNRGQIEVIDLTELLLRTMQ